MKSKVCLGDVAYLAGDKCLSLPTSERMRRRGPYPMYGENCAVLDIDDYTLEAGGTVMLGSIGSVLNNYGGFAATLEQGRCSAADNVHVIVPHDPADAPYICRALNTYADSALYVEGTSQCRMIGEHALMSIALPWPTRDVRDAYVAALAAFESRIAADRAAIPELLAQGDELYASMFPEGCSTVVVGEVAQWQHGTSVDRKDRAAGKPARIEGAAGLAGFCDEVLSDGLTVMAISTTRSILVRHGIGKLHPLAETIFVDQPRCQIPLPVLIFGLRAHGLRERPAPHVKGENTPSIDEEKFMRLEVRVSTPDVQGSFVAKALDLLERVNAAMADIESAIDERDNMARAFMLEGSFQGQPFATGDLPSRSGSDHSSRNRKEEALKASERAREAASALPGIPLTATQRAKLGPLADIVAKQRFGLEPADFAWELGPLAVVRAVASPGQWGRIRGAAMAFFPASTIDAVMAELADEDDLLPFLPNLNYATSSLQPSQLASLVLDLDAIDADAITPGAVRAVFELEPGCQTMPAEVLDIMGRVLAAAGERVGADSVYIGREGIEGLVDALGVVAPDLNARVQFDDFASLLQAYLVRAVATRGQRETRGGMGSSVGNALLQDDFADVRADLVTGVVPLACGEWTGGKSVATDDPRWVLGVPPRVRAQFAWVQNALYHQAEGGLTVLLAPCADLHADKGSEGAIRHALAASGRVRAVVALPGQLDASDLAPMCILVMGDERQCEPAGCLMVDALGLGEPMPREDLAAGVDPSTVPARRLPATVAGRIADVLIAWIQDGKVADEAGFARVVAPSELEAASFDLSPWTYLR